MKLPPSVRHAKKQQREATVWGLGFRCSETNILQPKKEHKALFSRDRPSPKPRTPPKHHPLPEQRRDLDRTVGFRDMP